MNNFETKKRQVERLLTAMEWLSEVERKACEDMIIGAATVNKMVALRAAKEEKTPA